MSEVGRLCRHVNHKRLRAVVVADGDLLLSPTVARRGGIARGGRACGTRGARAGGNIVAIIVLVGVAAVDAGVVVILLLVGVVIAVVYSRGRRLLSFVAELVFDYLVSEMQISHVQNPVVVLTIVLVSAHADLRLIPTVARRGGIRPEGRACGIRRTRCRI